MMAMPITPMPIIPAERFEQDHGLEAIYIVAIVLKSIALFLRMVLTADMIVHARQIKRWVAQLEELKGRIEISDARNLQVGGIGWVWEWKWESEGSWKKIEVENVNGERWENVDLEGRIEQMEVEEGEQRNVQRRWWRFWR